MPGKARPARRERKNTSWCRVILLNLLPVRGGAGGVFGLQGGEDGGEGGPRCICLATGGGHGRGVASEAAQSVLDNSHTHKTGPQVKQRNFRDGTRKRRESQEEREKKRERERKRERKRVMEGSEDEGWMKEQIKEVGRRKERQ